MDAKNTIKVARLSDALWGVVDAGYDEGQDVPFAVIDLVDKVKKDKEGAQAVTTSWKVIKAATTSIIGLVHRAPEGDVLYTHLALLVASSRYGLLGGLPVGDMLLQARIDCLAEPVPEEPWKLLGISNRWFRVFRTPQESLRAGAEALARERQERAEQLLRMVVPALPEPSEPAVQEPEPIQGGLF